VFLLGYSTILVRPRYLKSSILYLFPPQQAPSIPFLFLPILNPFWRTGRDPNSFNCLFLTFLPLPSSPLSQVTNGFFSYPPLPSLPCDSMKFSLFPPCPPPSVHKLPSFPPFLLFPPRGTRLLSSIPFPCSDKNRRKNPIHSMFFPVS